MTIGYNVTQVWLNAINSHEADKAYPKIHSHQDKMDLLTKHSSDLSRLLELVYAQKDKKQFDKKGKEITEKTVDFRSYPEYMDLVDRVRNNSMVSFNEDAEEIKTSVIPEHTYSWKGTEIDGLISSLNEYAKRLSNHFTPCMMHITQEFEMYNRIIECGARGRQRGEDEIKHTLSNMR